MTYILKLKLTTINYLYIGQMRSVNVFRLLAANDVERHLLLLQAEKTKLMLDFDRDIRKVDTKTVSYVEVLN